MTIREEFYNNLIQSQGLKMALTAGVPLILFGTVFVVMMIIIWRRDDASYQHAMTLPFDEGDRV